MDEKKLRKYAGLNEALSAPVALSVINGRMRGAKVAWEVSSHLTREPFGGSFSVTTKLNDRGAILDEQSIRFNSLLMSLATKEANKAIRDLDQDKKIAVTKGKALEKASKKFLAEVEKILKS